MHRSLIALSLATVVASALPALAGPNGGTSFMPLPPKKPAASKPAPYALLGDASEQSGHALRPGVTGKHPTPAWQRRPSEGR